MGSIKETFHSGFQYVADAFVTRPLPTLPENTGLQGRLTKQEQKEHRRRMEEERRVVSETFRRRRFKVIGGVLATSASAVVVARFGPSVFEFFNSFSGSENTFSGEVEDTKNIIAKWSHDVQNNAEKLEIYWPRIKKLAIAYFCKEMSEAFPKMQDKYRKENFENEVVLMEEDKFFQKGRRCMTGIDKRSLAFIDPLVDKAFVNKKGAVYVKNGVNTLAQTAFMSVVHELQHIAAERKLNQVDRGRLGLNLKEGEQIVYLKGIAALSHNPNTPNCFVHYRSSLEEAIVQDSTNRLIEKLGLIDKAYMDIVRLYREKVLVFYGGDNRELLELHQKTEQDEFFKSVGEKLGFKEIDQLGEGSSYLAQLFNKRD